MIVAPSVIKIILMKELKKMVPKLPTVNKIKMIKNQSLYEKM